MRSDVAKECCSEQLCGKKCCSKEFYGNECCMEEHCCEGGCGGECVVYSEGLKSTISQRLLCRNNTTPLVMMHISI